MEPLTSKDFIEWVPYQSIWTLIIEKNFLKRRYAFSEHIESRKTTETMSASTHHPQKQPLSTCRWQWHHRLFLQCPLLLSMRPQQASVGFGPQGTSFDKEIFNLGTHKHWEAVNRRRLEVEGFMLGRNLRKLRGQGAGSAEETERVGVLSGARISEAFRLSKIYLCWDPRGLSQLSLFTSQLEFITSDLTKSG